MTEPTGHTADGTPWEEARGPHLPDRITRVPIFVWPFVVLAVIHVLWTWMEYRQLVASDPAANLPQLTLSVVIRVSPILLGAALFLRHPDALVTLPLLVTGATLLALEQVLGLLRRPLVEVIWPPSSDVFDDSAEAFFFATLPSTIYGMIAVLIGAAGIWFLARGLQRARRRGDAWSRVLLIALAVVAILQSALRIRFYLPAIEETLGAGGPFVVAADAVISLVSVLATSYLVVVALAGWRAGERPSIGWALVALSGALTILVSGTYAVASVVPSDTPTDGSGILLGATTLALAAAPFALLVAFALGLPATEAPDADADAPDADAEAAEAAPTPDPPAATTPGSAGS